MSMSDAIATAATQVFNDARDTGARLIGKASEEDRAVIERTLTQIAALQIQALLHINDPTTPEAVAITRDTGHLTNTLSNIATKYGFEASAEVRAFLDRTWTLVVHRAINAVLPVA